MRDAAPHVTGQVKSAMVDSANSTVADLRSGMAEARTAAVRAAANAQDSCAAAVEKERAATARAASLSYVSLTC